MRMALSEVHRELCGNFAGFAIHGHNHPIWYWDKNLTQRMRRIRRGRRGRGVLLAFDCVSQIIQMLHGFVSGRTTVQIRRVQFCLIKEILSVQMGKLGTIMRTIFIDWAQTRITIQKLTWRASVAYISSRFLYIQPFVKKFLVGHSQLSRQFFNFCLLPSGGHGLATIAALGTIHLGPSVFLSLAHQWINGLVSLFGNLGKKSRDLLFVPIRLLAIRLEIDGGAHIEKSKGKPLISHRYNHLPLLPSDPGGFDRSWSYETCLRGQM